MVQKKNEIELYKQRYDLKKEHLDKLNQNNEEKIKEYEKEIQSSRETIVSLSNEIDLLGKQSAELDVNVAKAPEVEKKIAAFRKIESQIESKISKVEHDKHFYEHNADCPTCRQAITLEFKEGQLSELQSKEQELSGGIGELRTKITEQESVLKVIRDDEKKLNTLKIEIATKQTGIKGLNTAISKLEKQIKELQTTEKQDSNSNELVIIQDKAYYDVASTLLKDTGIKTNIVKQYLPVINKLVNKYLSSMDFFVNFNLDESFKETIKSRHRDDFSYHNFSEGEKQRIDMSLMLTWRAVAKLKNSINTNLLILDEVFDSSLDVGGTEDLMKILHTLNDVNLFVISHKGDILQDKFANTIRFEKSKNFSRIVK
jgi:DNA repair exonuclease SbcCD ATPase subunit